MKKTAILVGLLVLAASTVSAAQIDRYRTILDGRSCTIKYEMLINTAEKKNSVVSDASALKAMANEDSLSAKGPNATGMVVLGGNASFTSYGSEYVRQENLVKNNYRYSYLYTSDNGNSFYWGNNGKGVKADNKEYIFVDRNKVKGTPVSDGAIFDKGLYNNDKIGGVLYGEEEVAAVLSIISPNVNFIGAEKKYWLAASGALSTGATYEDYQWASADGEVDLVRFYFYQGELKKIASVHYRKLGPGKVKGDHYLIAIKEFSNTPATEYLSLPAGIKDVTKYAK